MSSEVWEKFPFLTLGNEIHLSPIGGTLFSNGTPTKLGVSTAEFASKCNGAHTVREILSSNWRTELQKLELIGFVSTALEAGWLALSETPLSSLSMVTGSKTAFYPPHMSIELTEVCNLSCEYCYRESDCSKQGHMPVEALLMLLEKLWTVGLRSVELTGGEPLLNEGFVQILDFCFKKFNLVGVLSNGTLLTEKFDDKLVAAGDKLILSISLDASTPEIHDARRGVPGAFNRTVANMKRLANLGVFIRVSMVVDEGNFTEIEKTLLLSKELGAKAFSYTPMLPFGRGRDRFSTKWRLDGKEVAKKEEEIAERYKGFLGILPEECVNEIEGEYGCGAGYRTFAMDPWGYIRPCVTFGAKELVFGNLLSQSLEEVFSHPAIFEINKLRMPSPIYCSGCNHSDFCRYCWLRGLHGSLSESSCNWRNQRAINSLLPFWEAPSK